MCLAASMLTCTQPNLSPPACPQSSTHSLYSLYPSPILSSILHPSSYHLPLSSSHPLTTCLILPIPICLYRPPVLCFQPLTSIDDLLFYLCPLPILHPTSTHSYPSYQHYPSIHSTPTPIITLSSSLLPQSSRYILFSPAPIITLSSSLLPQSSRYPLLSCSNHHAILFSPAPIITLSSSLLL